MSSSKGSGMGGASCLQVRGSGMGGASCLQVRGVAWEGLQVFK